MSYHELISSGNLQNIVQSTDKVEEWKQLIAAHITPILSRYDNDGDTEDIQLTAAQFNFLRKARLQGFEGVKGIKFIGNNLYWFQHRIIRNDHTDQRDQAETIEFKEQPFNFDPVNPAFGGGIFQGGEVTPYPTTISFVGGGTGGDWRIATPYKPPTTTGYYTITAGETPTNTGTGITPFPYYNRDE